MSGFHHKSVRSYERERKRDRARSLIFLSAGTSISVFIIAIFAMICFGTAWEIFNPCLVWVEVEGYDCYGTEYHQSCRPAQECIQRRF